MSEPIFEADFTGTGKNFQSCIMRNYKDIRFQAIFTNDFPSATVSAILCEFVNDPTGEKNADNINNFIATYGVNQGIPYQVTMDGNVLFSGIINISDPSAMYECDIVKVPLKRIGGIDWFMNLAEASPFRAMDDAGLFSPPPGDPGYNSTAFKFYKKIAYALTFRDYELALTTFIQEIILLQHTYKAVTDTVNDVENVIAAYTTDVVQAGTSSATAVQSILALIGQVAYDGVLIAALIGLTENLINETVGVTKYKYCMMVNDLIEAGIYYINNVLGVTVPGILTFKSTIFDGSGYGGIYKNTCIIPKKMLHPLSPISSKLGLPVLEDFVSNLLKGGVLTTGNESVPGTIGPPKGYPDGNFKKLLNDLKAVFNGAVKVVGTNIQLEEKHFWNNIALFDLPNVDKPGYNKNWPQPDVLNWNELAFNYMVRFQTDSSDEMTLKNYRGTTAIAMIQPNSIRNVQYLTPPPSVDLILPFALAKRKETYNAYEQVVYDIIVTFCNTVNTLLVNPMNTIINGINHILSIFGKSIANIPKMTAANIFNRIGWLELSNDTFEIPKIFIAAPLSNNIVNIISDIVPAGVPQFFNSAGQPENAMSAAALLGTPSNNQFHGFNLATRGNQWLGYKDKVFPMCLKDYLNIINKTNVLKDAAGIYGKFESLEWDPYRKYAEKAKYWRNSTYDRTLIESLNYDGN